MTKARQILTNAISTATGAPVAFGPVVSSNTRKVFARVDGTGAVTSTIIIDSGMDGVDGYYPAFTITLSGTNSDLYVGSLVADNSVIYRARLTAITGTGATANVWIEE